MEIFTLIAALFVIAFVFYQNAEVRYWKKQAHTAEAQLKLAQSKYDLLKHATNTNPVWIDTKTQTTV